MNKQKIGDFIKKKRKEKGLTQTELAEKLEITDRAISKWERGVNCPDISLLKDLCKILEIDINELLSGKELDKVSKEDSEDILVETVRTYTNIEKKKNKKLLIFTILLLIFYVFLAIAMYLTYNQLNKKDGLTWDTIENKRIVDKLYTALEKYDYTEIKKIMYGNYIFGNTPDTFLNTYVEDENNCSKNHLEWGLVCRLKDFENSKIRFKSHKFEKNYYGDNGNFVVEYELTVEYNNKEYTFNNCTVTHNGVLTFSYPNLKAENNDLQFSEPVVFNKITNILQMGEYCFEKNDKCYMDKY